MDGLLISFTAIPQSYMDIMLGNMKGWSDPTSRAVLFISLGGLIAGTVQAAWRREGAALLFAVPVLLADLFVLILRSSAGFLSDRTMTLMVTLVLAYLVAQIAIILAVATRCRSARSAGLLIGWFCFVYAIMPVLLLLASLASI